MSGMRAPTNMQAGSSLAMGLKSLVDSRCLHDSPVSQQDCKARHAAHVAMALLCFESTTPALTIRKSMPPGCSRATSFAAACICGRISQTRNQNMPTVWKR